MTRFAAWVVNVLSGLLALILVLLAVALVGCASAPVVTQPAPEVFSVEAGARMAQQCADELPLAEEQCICMAAYFVGKPVKVERTELQAMVDAAWAKCVGPSVSEGQVSL